jgi:hypothetical protein
MEIKKKTIEFLKFISQGATSLFYEIFSEPFKVVKKIIWSTIETIVAMFSIYSIDKIYEWLFPNSENTIIDMLIYHKGLTIVAIFIVANYRLFRDNVKINFIKEKFNE